MTLMGVAPRPGTGVRRDAAVRMARNIDIFIAGVDGLEPVPRKDIKASLVMQGFQLLGGLRQVGVVIGGGNPADLVKISPSGFEKNAFRAAVSASCCADYRFP